VLIEQKCETSPVDRLLNLLRCLANKLHLIKLLTKRQTQQFPAQGKIKLTELKLLGHQRLFRERFITRIAVCVEFRTLLQAQIHKREIDHDLARLNLGKGAFNAFEPWHGSVNCAASVIERGDKHNVTEPQQQGLGREYVAMVEIIKPALPLGRKCGERPKHLLFKVSALTKHRTRQCM
jgi:hypothetical protein